MKTSIKNVRYFSNRFLVIFGILAIFGATRSQAQQIGSYVLPQFAFGGGWYSALYFTNLTGAPASFTVSFLSDKGTPLTVPALNGSSQPVNLAAYGTAIIEAPNTGDAVTGYATFTLPTGVGGYGIFRRSASGIPDQEAVVPFSGSANTTDTITWDETGPSTAIAIVNPSSTDATIAITVRGLDGSMIGTSSLSLPALNHTALFLKTLAGLSGMTGHRGSAQFIASSGNVVVLGLRANGSAITSIPMTANYLATSVYAFKTGRYVSPSNILSGTGAIQVVGPGVLSDGSTFWSLVSAPKASSYTYPIMATWYYGTAANNPLAARLAAAKITSTAWVYGIGHSSTTWSQNDLLGFSQIGNTLTIARFTDGGTDSNAAVDQITYTLDTGTSSSPTAVTAFQAGKYLSPSDILSGAGGITIDGPGATSGGITAWSLSASPGVSSYTYPSSAQFYSGQIANSPLAARIQKAGITSTGLSFGVGDSSTTWARNDLLGFIQIGNTVTIMRFTDGGIDLSTPVDQITYTLAPAQ